MAGEDEEDVEEEDDDEEEEEEEGVVQYDWFEGWDDNYKRMYYFNPSTSETQWVVPDAPYAKHGTYDSDSQSESGSGSGSGSESESSGEEGA